MTHDEAPDLAAWAVTPPLGVVEAMSRSGFHRGHPEVVMRETHTAWVLLAGDRAYKIKKPVRTEFLDFSTLERRRRVCAEEVRINRALAPTLDMRVRAVVPRAESYVLAEHDHPAAAEYVIEMRRFDERRTMASLIEAGALADQQIETLGRRLAAFHADAASTSPTDFVGDVKGTYDRNARELLALADDVLARRGLAIDRFAGAFLLAHRDEIGARARAGRVRDGHGDLRAEHIVFEDPLAIVDRLEFDPRLRSIDVADDLAFLTMDLERLGAGDAARRLVQAYRDAGGDPGSEALRCYYGVYRALVRAKVALLRARQLDDAAAAAARGRAEELLALAERLAWRARGPLVVAIGGPPASGKSTLAAALARRSGWLLLSSDVVRKQVRGLAPDERAPDEDYAPAARASVYRELGERARSALTRGEGAIVDATFGGAALRAAFLGGLDTETRSLRALECRASDAVRARRARRRRPAEAHGSDAGPAVAARLGAEHSGWDELPDERILMLRSGVDADLLVDRVADWLDMASVDWPARSRRDTDAGAEATP